MRRRVEEVLDALGIAHLRDRDPATLSGGERQRCAIAGALAAAPSALVLDEPTSQLDPQGADDVLAALARLNADLGTTVRARRAPARARRAARRPRGARRRRCASARPTGPGTVLADYPGAPTVTRLGRAARLGPAAAHRARRARARGAPSRSTSRRLTTPAAARPPARRCCSRRTACASSSAGARCCAASTSTSAGRRGRAARAQRRRARPRCCGRSAGLLVRRRAARSSATSACAVRAAEPEHAAVRAHGPARAGGDPAPARAHRRRRARSTTGSTRSTSPTSPRATRAASPAVSGSGSRSRRSRSAARRCCCSTSPRAAWTRRRATRSSARCASTRHAGGAVVLATHDVELAARCATHAVVLGDGESWPTATPRHVLAGSLFAPQVLRVLPPFLTVEEVDAELAAASDAMSVVATAPATRAHVRPIVVYVADGRGRRGGVPLPVLAARDRAHRPGPHRRRAARRRARRRARGRRGDARGAARHDERRDRRASSACSRRRAGLLRLIDLPGGGSGIFFLVVLAGAAFGPRFGLLLGLCAMAVSAIVTGGIGPWLPFQMLALGWMGGGAGLRRPGDGAGSTRGSRWSRSPRTAGCGASSTARS